MELPFLQKIYGYYGAPGEITNVHLADEGHDYGPSKRAATYRFLAERLTLAHSAVDEAKVTIEPPSVMHVFDADFPVPASGPAPAPNKKKGR